MNDWYCEIIDCRGRGAKTGKGTAHPTEDGARAAFEKARTLEVPKEHAEFLVDLHNPNGEILDTVRIDATGFEALIGEAPKSVETYLAFDAAWWRRARARRQQKHA